MSYSLDTSASKKKSGYTKIQADEENSTNPLLTGDGKRKK